jgi:hypothetical protein
MLPRYLSITADQIREVAAATFRADNRVVLTYLPELPPAETASVTEEATESPDATPADETADEEEVAA